MFRKPQSTFAEAELRRDQIMKNNGPFTVHHPHYGRVKFGTYYGILQPTSNPDQRLGFILQESTVSKKFCGSKIVEVHLGTLTVLQSAIHI